MLTVLDHLPMPAVIAHRGASAHAPENTLEAFQLAIDHGADAIELDVRFTADKQVIVHHDAHLDAGASAKRRISSSTLAELRAYAAPSSGRNADDPQSILTLPEVLEHFAGKIPLNIEMKDLASPWSDLPDLVAEIVLAGQYQEHVLLSSFNPLAVRKIHYALPPAATGYLIKYPWRWMITSVLLQRLIPHQSIHLPLHGVSKHLIKQCHHAGRKVFVYTVNKPSQVLQLARIKVDGIFTDDPLMARQALEREDFRQNSPIQ